MNPAADNRGHREHREAPPRANKSAPRESVARRSGGTEDEVTFQTADGLALRAALVRVTRHAVEFEIYNPGATLQLSEVLSELKIVLRGRTIYSGQAVVRNLAEAGLNVVCEATLNEAQ